MKKTSLVLVLILASCGNSAVQGDLVGQAKKVTLVTPLICASYIAFDVSLGVMKEGTGSMSTQDMWLTVGAGVDLNLLKDAVAKSSLVKIKYDTRRLAVCTEDYILTSVEIVK